MAMIHPTALVGADVTLADEVRIGPFCVLEGKISILERTTLKANVQVYGEVKIGAGNTIFSNVVIGDDPQDLTFNSQTKSGVRIGNENVIRENVTIHKSTIEGGVTQLGDHSYLMSGTHLGHDSVVGNYSILANNTLLGGHVQVGDRVFLGGGTGVHQFVRVGSFALTQGNSGLSKDLPPFCVSHQINVMSGLNSIGMKRGGIGAETRKEIKRLFFILFQSRVNLSQAIERAREQEWGSEALLLLDAVSAPSRKGVVTR